MKCCVVSGSRVEFHITDGEYNRYSRGGGVCDERRGVVVGLLQQRPTETHRQPFHQRRPLHALQPLAQAPVAAQLRGRVPLLGGTRTRFARLAGLARFARVQLRPAHYVALCW